MSPDSHSGDVRNQKSDAGSREVESCHGEKSEGGKLRKRLSEVAVSLLDDVLYAVVHRHTRWN